ncbi:MAG: hypothetical protein HUU54_03180 [Ignavibacteriaceae bacterium]|nr:hypothetical protein [Ignavibacteriaceae bacterium]
MAEQVIHESGDIKITTTRVVLGANTYSLANITGIRVIGELNKLAIGLVVIGVILLLIGLSEGIMMAVIGAALGALGYFLGFKKYYLHFDTASGAVQAYQGKPDMCFELKNKIEEAMAARG